MPRQVESSTKGTPQSPTKPQNIISKEKKTTASRVNAVSSNEPPNVNSVVLNTIKEQGSSAQILAGQAEVFSSDKTKNERVEVLLDTGSDRSFITNALAERLQLKNNDSVDLTIHTFANSKPSKVTCGVTTLKLQDANGEEHEITITRIDTITRPLERFRLNNQDRDFLHQNNIKLSIDSDSATIQPEVLLGCVDLFSFLESGLAPNKILPSGLKLIPSKLGYLVTGATHNQNNTSGDTMYPRDDTTQTFHNTAEQQSLEDFSHSSHQESTSSPDQVN